MKRIKPFVPNGILQSIYKVMIQPYFDYCSPLWENCSAYLKEKLQIFQKHQFKMFILFAHYCSSFEAV